VFFKSFCWLWNEPLNKLPLAMKHVAWVFSGFQTHSLRYRFGTERVRDGQGLGGCGLEVCGCGAGSGKISQITAGA